MVRTILRKACREWVWIDTYPVPNLRREPDRRVQWSTETEAARLLAILLPHLSNMVQDVND
jgi:hypothetical protein